MRIAIAILVLISCFHVSTYAATTYEVSLPGLVGDYPGFKEYEFNLVVTPTVVYNVWIRFSGTIETGQYYCYVNGPPPEGPFPLGMILQSTMPDTASGDSWYAEDSIDPVSGSFELTIPFVSYPIDDPTWEFLLLGGGIVSCTGYTGMLNPECFIDINPSVTIEDATLIIEGDFFVPVESSTWGYIKSLYK